MPRCASFLWKSETWTDIASNEKIKGRGLQGITIAAEEPVAGRALESVAMRASTTETQSTRKERYAQCRFTLTEVFDVAVGEAMY